MFLNKMFHYIVIRLVMAPALRMYMPREGRRKREMPGCIVSCEISCPNIEKTFTVIVREVVTYTYPSFTLISGLSPSSRSVFIFPPVRSHADAAFAPKQTQHNNANIRIRRRIFYNRFVFTGQI